MKKKTGIISLALLLALTGCVGKGADGNKIDITVDGSSDSASANASGEASADSANTALYESFLKNEAKVKIGAEKNLGSYFDFTEYQGQEFTLEELVNTIINGYVENEYAGDDFALEKIEYAYIDCGNDGNEELALHIKTPGLDDWNETIVIKEKDGKLETVYSDMAWSRSKLYINKYGFIYGDGSNGAGSHGYDKAFLDAEGKYHFMCYEATECGNPYEELRIRLDDDNPLKEITVYLAIDENRETGEEDYAETENGYKDYICTSKAYIHDDSLYEESGEIYKYLNQNNLLPEGKLVTISEAEKMLAEKENLEGLTEEIKNGDPVEWKELEYSFEPVTVEPDNIDDESYLSQVAVDYLDDVSDKFPNYSDVSESTNRDPNSYESLVLFYASEDVKDFKIFTLHVNNIEEMGDSDFVPKYDVTEIYNAPELKKDTPIAIPLSFPSHFPDAGFSYTDEEGNVKTFTIIQSGKDGSLAIYRMEE